MPRPSVIFGWWPDMCIQSERPCSYCGEFGVVDGVEFEQGEPTLFACPACYQELELWRWDEHCDQQDEV